MKSPKLLILIAVLLAVTLFTFLSGEFDRGIKKKGGGKVRSGVEAGISGQVSISGSKVDKIGLGSGQGAKKNHAAGKKSGMAADSGSGNLEDLDRWLNEGDDNNGGDIGPGGDSGSHSGPRMTAGDMQNELDYVLQIEDPAERRQALVELGKTMGYRADPEMVAEFLQSLTEGNDKIAYMAGYIKTMVDGKNPEAAAQVLTALGDEKLTAAMIPLLAVRWASKDLQGAYNWAAQISNQQNQNIAMVRIGRVMAVSDPEGAAQWASQFENKAVGANIMNYAVRVWASKDVGAAADWVVRMGEGNEKERMIDAVAVAWAGYDPAAAAEWVIKNDTSASRDNILASVASAWSLREPEQASKWAAQFPNPQARDMALAQTTYQWAKRDALSAGRWADSLAADQGQRRALTGVAAGWAVKDPAGAANWVNGVRDPALRNQLQESVARQWLSRDREQAVQWIMDSDLPDAAKNRLLPPSP